MWVINQLKSLIGNYNEFRISNKGNDFYIKGSVTGTEDDEVKV